jgi:hypothetical protein
MLAKIGWIAAISVGMFGKWAFLAESPFTHPRSWSERDSSLFWLLAVLLLVGTVVIFWMV